MLTEENKKALRQRLEELRQQLITARDRETSNAAEMSADAYEEHPLGNHMADEATDLMEQELEIGFQQSDTDTLHQVEHSLQLMDEGRYGLDEETGEEIPLERLEVLPYATRTVRNQANVDVTTAASPDTLNLRPADEANRRLSS